GIPTGCQTTNYRISFLREVLGRLVTISLAELEGRNPSEEDYEFIERFGLILAPLGEGLSDTQASQTALIADVHTDGNTQQVLEEAVGYVKLIVAAYPIPEGRMVLGAGPVFSYYEFKWPMIDRLTDEKWTNMLFAGNQPAEPGWVRSFMHPVSLPPNDADGDRLPDAWETALWGSISAVNDPAGDFDGDGFSNEQEFHAGTNPRDATSLLQVVTPQPVSSGLELRWNGVQAKRYRVFYSDDLINWYLLQAPVIAEGAMAGLLDPGASNTRQRFYRVKVVP
ncbi:MAG: DUF3160 domain-containing protein, partial [Verrucomicrobiota bacterium]